MKKIQFILVFALTLAFTQSCNEDGLELTNPNALSPDTFFQSEAQVQSSVNAIYANLQTRGLYARHMFFMMDNFAHENGGNTQLEADKLQYLNFSVDASHGATRAYWESCYRGINKANFVIGNEEKINAIPDSQLSTERKAKFVGEAKFCLFNKVFENLKKRLVELLNLLKKVFSALNAFITRSPPKVSSIIDKKSPCSF